MRFDKWVEENRIRQREVAKLLGVSISYVSCLLNGKNSPTLSQVDKIYNFTNGEVTWRDLLKAVRKKQPKEIEK